MKKVFMLIVMLVCMWCSTAMALDSLNMSEYAGYMHETAKIRE